MYKKGDVVKGKVIQVTMPRRIISTVFTKDGVDANRIINKYIELLGIISPFYEIEVKEATATCGRYAHGAWRCVDVDGLAYGGV